MEVWKYINIQSRFRVEKYSKKESRIRSQFCKVLVRGRACKCCFQENRVSTVSSTRMQDSVQF